MSFLSHIHRIFTISSPGPTGIVKGVVVRDGNITIGMNGHGWRMTNLPVDLSYLSSKPRKRLRVKAAQVQWDNHSIRLVAREDEEIDDTKIICVLKIPPPLLGWVACSGGPKWNEGEFFCFPGEIIIQRSFSIFRPSSPYSQLCKTVQLIGLLRKSRLLRINVASILAKRPYWSEWYYVWTGSEFLCFPPEKLKHYHKAYCY